MKKKKSIGGIVALIAGIVLVLGGVTGILVIRARRNRQEQEQEQMPLMDLETATIQLENSQNSGSGPSVFSFSPRQIRVMQTYLLQLGIQHNNQYIIDAIQLTGGIDGIIGSGFHAAVKEARDKGYLRGYEDILRRLGYA